MNKSRRATPPTKSPWGCIILALCPLVLLGCLMAFLHSNRPTREQIQAQQRAKAEQLAIVAEGLRASGAEFRLRSAGSYEVIIPLEHISSVKPIAARELAIITQSKTGGIVKVITPAGQVLAEAP